MLYWSESAGASVYIGAGIIGHMEDIMLIPGKKSIMGFVLEKRNKDLRSRYFPFIQIKEMKRDSVHLKEPAEIRILTKAIRKRIILSAELFDSTVLDEKGEFIGKVVDLAFDQGNGTIKEIILSESILEDIWNGRKKMPVLGDVEFSHELIRIDRDTREEITILNKGLKNWLKFKEVL